MQIDFDEPFDMCTLNIRENNDLDDCDPFSNIVECRTRVIVRETGDGATYKKKAYIYVKFRSLEAASGTLFVR